jgi:hypothetical protein
MSSVMEDTFHNGSQNLDPICVISRLGYLSFLEIGTKVRLGKHTIEVCPPGLFDTLYRVSQKWISLEVQDIFLLELPIRQSVEWYELQGGFRNFPEMELLFQKAICGLEYFHEMYSRYIPLDSFIVKLQEILRKSLSSSLSTSLEFVVTRTPELAALYPSNYELLKDSFSLDSSSQKHPEIKIHWNQEDIKKIYSLFTSLESGVETSIILISLDRFLKEKEQEIELLYT